MIIANFNIFRVITIPDETNAILVIDADGVLAGAIPFERFKAISGRNGEVVERDGFVELNEFS